MLFDINPLRSEERMPQNKSRRKTTLSEQIDDLPDFEQVSRVEHIQALA